MPASGLSIPSSIAVRHVDMGDAACASQAFQKISLTGTPIFLIPSPSWTWVKLQTSRVLRLRVLRNRGRRELIFIYKGDCYKTYQATLQLSNILTTRNSISGDFIEMESSEGRPTVKHHTANQIGLRYPPWRLQDYLKILDEATGDNKYQLIMARLRFGWTVARLYWWNRRVWQPKYMVSGTWPDSYYQVTSNFVNSPGHLKQRERKIRTACLSSETRC